MIFCYKQSSTVHPSCADSPNTVTLAEAVDDPIELVALHTYTPASFCDTSNSRSSPPVVPRVDPSARIHVIVTGFGGPSALQLKMTSPPMETTVFCGALVISGTSVEEGEENGQRLAGDDSQHTK